jgi:hypothetical protein
VLVAGRFVEARVELAVGGGIVAQIIAAATDSISKSTAQRMPTRLNPLSATLQHAIHAGYGQLLASLASGSTAS